MLIDYEDVSLWFDVKGSWAEEMATGVGGGDWTWSDNIKTFSDGLSRAVTGFHFDGYCLRHSSDTLPQLHQFTR